MRYNLLHVCVIVTCWVISTASTWADVIVSGFLTGPGGGVEISSLGSYSTGQSNLFGNYTNSAHLAMSDWDLQIRTSTVFNGSPGIFGLQQASASISVSRAGLISGPMSLPSTLTLRGSFDGQVHFDPGTNHMHDGFLRFGDYQIPNLDELFFPDAGTYDIAMELEATITVDAAGAFVVDFGFGTDLFTRRGNNLANFFDTMEVTAILLPTGEIPELAGYTLTFADGVSSPNAVPEPTSSLLLCMAGLAAGARRRMRSVGCLD